MATPTTTTDIILWGFTAKDLIMILISFIGAGGISGYFLKSHYDLKRDRFLNGDKLTLDELDLLENPQRAEELAEKPREEKKMLRQSYALHLEVEDIQGKQWSEHYLNTVERLLKGMARILGDKSTVICQPVGRAQWINPDAFTVNSYEFCLKLALAYPLMFALMSWLISGQLMIGGLTLVPESALGGRTQAFFGMFLTTASLFQLKISQVRWLIPRFFIILMGLFIVVDALVGVVAVTGAVAVAVASAVAVSGTIASAGVGALSLAIAIATALALALLVTPILAASGFLSSDIIFSVPVSGVLAIAGAVAVSGAGAGALALASSIAIVGAVAGVLMGGIVNFRETTDVVAFIAISSLILTFILPIIADKYYVKETSDKATYWLGFNVIGVVYCAIGILIAISQSGSDNVELLLLPVLLGLLPLLNACVDWLSLNITRSFLIHIYHKHDSWRNVALLVVVDVFLAIFFVFSVTTVLLLVISLINVASWLMVDKVVLDFSQLMIDLLDPEKFWTVFWVHGMVLSTLVPTMLHLIFALYATALWPKTGWHKASQKTFWNNEKSRIQLLRWHNFSWLLMLVFIIMTIMLIYAGGAQLKFVAVYLWQWADGLLRVIDPIYIGVTR